MSYATRSLFSGSYKDANQFRVEKNFFDAEIVIKEKKYQAHRIVLASMFKYFEKLFTGKNVKNDQTEFVITDDWLTEDAFEAVLEYSYTGNLLINDDNASAICLSAKRLNSPQILKQAEDWLCRDIDELNILNRTLLAVDYKLVNLKKNCGEFYGKNPRVYHQLVAFTMISKEEMEKLSTIFYDNSRVQENYEALLKWIKHDVDDREEHFSGLFLTLPLKLENREYVFKTLVNEPLVNKNAPCLLKILMLFNTPLENNPTGAEYPYVPKQNENKNNVKLNLIAKSKQTSGQFFGKRPASPESNSFKFEPEVEAKNGISMNGIAGTSNTISGKLTNNSSDDSE